MARQDINEVDNFIPDNNYPIGNTSDSATAERIAQVNERHMVSRETNLRVLNENLETQRLL